MLAAVISALLLTAAFAWALLDSAQYRRRLTALRRNCYLTDERGHRRRYADCSAEVRDLAETTTKESNNG